MNSSIKIRKMVKIANPSSASMTRNSEISLQKTAFHTYSYCLAFFLPCSNYGGTPCTILLPTLVGHPVQSFCYIDDQKFRVRIPSIPKKQYLPYTYLFPLPCLFLCSELWRNTLYRLIIMRLLQKFSISAIACHDIQQLSINLPEFTQFVQLMN